MPMIIVSGFTKWMISWRYGYGEVMTMKTTGIFRTLVRLGVVDNWNDVYLWMMWMNDINRYEEWYGDEANRSYTA